MYIHIYPYIYTYIHIYIYVYMYSLNVFHGRLSVAMNQKKRKKKRLENWRRKFGSHNAVILWKECDYISPSPVEVCNS